MGCRSDYLEPNRREIEHQRAAKLLKFTLMQLDRSVDFWLERETRNMYAADPRTIPMLCDLLTRLSDEDCNRIVYDARNRDSRDLANWWEVHQEADKKRLEQEQLAQVLSDKRKMIIASLSEEAKELLGIKDEPCLSKKSRG